MNYGESSQENLFLIPQAQGRLCLYLTVSPYLYLDVYRMSIMEMRKDHEQQLQRLKQLKNQEIDAVTSATAYTR